MLPIRFYFSKLVISPFIVAISFFIVFTISKNYLSHEKDAEQSTIKQQYMLVNSDVHHCNILCCPILWAT